MASIDNEIAGLTLKINDKAIGTQTVIDEGDSAIGKDRSYPVSASVSADIATGKYELEVAFDTVDKVQDGGGKLYTWAVATSGILPADWSVPSGNTGGQFKALSDAMATEATANPVYSADDYKNFSNPDYTGDSHTKDYNDAPWMGVYSGYYGDDGLSDQGFDGRYWSSTAYDGGVACRLYFHSTSVFLTSASDKYYGFALRGVL